MQDLAYLAIAFGFFALTGWLVRWLDRLEEGKS